MAGCGHHLLGAEEARGPRLPHLVERLAQQVAEALAMAEARARQHVAGRADVEKPVGRRAAAVAEAVGDGVEEAQGQRRVPDELDAALRRTSPCTLDDGAGVGVAQGQRLVGPGRPARDDEVHREPLEPAAGHEVDDRLDEGRVAAAQCRVRVDAHAARAEPLEPGPQAVEGARLAHQRVVHVGARTLERQLSRVEAGVGQLAHARVVEALAVRDQVDAKAEVLRVAHEPRQAGPQRRLAAGEADARAPRVAPDDLQHAADLVVAHHAVLAPAGGQPGGAATRVAEAAREVAAVRERDLGEHGVPAEVGGERLLDDGAPAVALAEPALEPRLEIDEELVDEGAPTRRVAFPGEHVGDAQAVVHHGMQQADSRAVELERRVRDEDQQVVLGADHQVRTRIFVAVRKCSVIATM